MADDNNSLTAEERENAADELLKEAEKFIEKGNQADGDNDDEVKEPSRKKKRGRNATKKDQLHDVKVAVCNEIRKYPELYQITHKSYQDKQLKESTWQAVSEAVSKSIGTSTSVDICKKHWTALKESTR